MWPFETEITEIDAIDRELKRLHRLIDFTQEPKTNGLIWQQITKLQNTLNKIARKNNGLEY